MKIERFENVLTDKTSLYSKVPKESYLPQGEFAIVDQGKEFIGGYTNDKSLVKNIDEPIIVFGDHTRIFKYIDFPIAIGADGVKVLHIKSSKIYPKYIYYYLLSVKIFNAGYSRHFKFLKDVKFPIPEKLEDQIRIATVLSKVETLIQKRKYSIDLLDEFLKSTFLKMFGDPVMNEKGWIKKKLKDVCLKITDGTHFSPPIKESGIPYITAKHVRENRIDFFSNPWFISIEDHKEIYKRCDPKLGDILYIKDGATTGYAAINKYDFQFSMLSSLALLKSNLNACNSEYLCSWLNNLTVKSKILKEMAGGAIQRLTLTKINELPINVPPIKLQNRFASIVEKIEFLKTQYQNSLQELENLFASLSQKAFKGDLDLSKMALEGNTVHANKPSEEFQTREELRLCFEPYLAEQVYRKIENIMDSKEVIKNILRRAWNTVKSQNDRKELKLIMDEEVEHFLSEARKVELIKLQNNTNPSSINKKRKTDSKLIWEKVSTQQVANWIKENYTGYHFTSEMLVRFLMEEHVTFPDYYSSEELKKNPQANEADDLKSLIFSAVSKENPFLKLEQVFYNGVEENIQLKITESDYEHIKDLSPKERSGIYFNIIE